MAISKVKLPNNSTEELHDSRIHGVKIFYGTCSTAAATGTKAVTCPAFTSDDLGNGTILFVSFTYNNTAEPADVKLNVNSTGAFQVRKVYNYASSNLSNAGEIRGIVHQFICWTSDEEQNDYRWYLVGVDFNTNTTYSAMSQANIDAGTSTSGLRISPKLLRDNFYTEDEVDALISGVTEVPTLYISDDSSINLTSEQCTHNLDVINSLVGSAEMVSLFQPVKFTRSNSSELIFSTSPECSVITFIWKSEENNVVTYILAGVEFNNLGIFINRSRKFLISMSSTGNIIPPFDYNKFILLEDRAPYIDFEDTDNEKFTTPKTVSDFLIEYGPGIAYPVVHPEVKTTQPQGGFVPNIFYNLGTISGSVTFSLATPEDADIVNHYYWTFDTSSTAPTITWPSGITWAGGSAPTISANKHYEVSVLDGTATYLEI